MASNASSTTTSSRSPSPSFSASSTSIDLESEGEHVTSLGDDHETTCWGCGLRLLVSPLVPVFKCGWCGAITSRKTKSWKSEPSWFRRWRDRCFFSMLLIFILFVIGGGIWAVSPIVFQLSQVYCFVHITLTVIFALSTLSTFSLAAFGSAGAPPDIPWGSYPAIGKDGLENYTFCNYCCKPKSPRTHHCRSCGKCILDMDHHCPFIGNCVGAANHRCFVIFLIIAIISANYTAIMTSYAAVNTWPPLNYKTRGPLIGFSRRDFAFTVIKMTVTAFWRSLVLLSARGFILVYLFIVNVAVMIGLSILLWQQLSFIYHGKTYLSRIKQEHGHAGEGSFQNFVHFFGCPYLAARYFSSFFNSRKSHEK